MVDRRLIQLSSFSPVDRNVVILNCHQFLLAYNIQTKRSEVLENPTMSAEYPKSKMDEILQFVLTPRLTILRPCARTVSSDYVFKEKKGWSYIARRLREEAMEVPTTNNRLDSLKTEEHQKRHLILPLRIINKVLNYETSDLIIEAYSTIDWIVSPSYRHPTNKGRSKSLF